MNKRPAAVRPGWHTHTRSAIRGPDVYLIAILAVAGIDRINFAPPSLPLALTPFLVLLPVTVAGALLSWARVGRVGAEWCGRSAGVGISLIFALMVVSAVSVLATEHTDLAYGRLALSVLNIAGVVAAVQWSLRRNDPVVIFRSAAWCVLVLSVFIDVLSFLSWLRFGTGVSVSLGPIDLAAGSIGQDIPRLSGLSLDPNRGALAVTVAAFVLLADPLLACKVGNARASLAILGVSGLVVAATLSRSGALAWLICAVGVVVVSARGRPRAKMLAALLGATALVGYVLARVVTGSPSIDLTLLSDRLSVSEGSSGGVHLSLYSIASNIVASSAWDPFTGIGFGNSYTALRSVYGANEYGNFHSVFVTFLVEVGVMGLLLVLVLMAVPLLGRRRYLAAGLIAFSVLYQASSDPVYWYALALLWILAEGPAVMPVKDAGLVEALRDRQLARRRRVLVL